MEKTRPANIEWEKIKRGRSSASRQFPSILKIPLIRSHRELLLHLFKNELSLLDMGANDRSLLDFLHERGKDGINYFSYDIDRNNYHDYYDISSIDGKFDCITIFEVIEHMPVAEVKATFDKAYDLLNNGGFIIVSTPNVYHPVRFWRDCTHTTPFAYDEVVGLLIGSSFVNFEVYRVKTNMAFKDWLRYWFYKPLLKLLDIDFAPGIVVVGRVVKE